MIWRIGKEHKIESLIKNPIIVLYKVYFVENTKINSLYSDPNVETIDLFFHVILFCEQFLESIFDPYIMVHDLYTKILYSSKI